MSIYLVRTQDYEVPAIFGYYSTRNAAEARKQFVSADDFGGFEDDEVIIEEITIDKDMQPTWL